MKCFYGIIEGLKNTAISFEGTTIQELKKDFKEAIDCYLENCKENNKEEKREFIEKAIELYSLMNCKQDILFLENMM